MGLGATTGWSSMAAVRFLLGFTEGAVGPSFMIITSGWYKRSEHPIRIAYVSDSIFSKLSANLNAAPGSPCPASPKLLAPS
jgi:MFS family permease